MTKGMEQENISAHTRYLACRLAVHTIFFRGTRW